MALAQFFDRNATAASQILTSFDAAAFRRTLGEARIGIGFGADATSSREGQLLLEMLVRLLARLYPTVSLHAASGNEEHAESLVRLAKTINPRIEFDTEPARIGVAVGERAPQFAEQHVFAGSDGWDAWISSHTKRGLGGSANPFGPGAAACFAAANVFRAVFLREGVASLDRELCFSVLEREAGASADPVALRRAAVDDPVLVGVGAVGNAAAWALARAPLSGRVHLVDPEPVELSNLQRYALTARRDVGKAKVQVVGKHFTGELTAEQHELPWAEFLELNGYRWSTVLAAVDSARDRRAVQASLPRSVLNAWTQAGDLGVSSHAFGDGGACLGCLYLPQGPAQSEDAVIANALAVPDRLMQVRELLFSTGGAPRDLLEAVARGLDVPLKRVLPFEGRPVRELYVRGVCGGVVLPLRRVETPPQDVHVPLAHQSALAGVVLAGALVAESLGQAPATTAVTRIDMMRPLGSHLTQPALKDTRGICFCDDPDFLETYRRKYSPALRER